MNFKVTNLGRLRFIPCRFLLHIKELTILSLQMTKKIRKLLKRYPSHPTTDLERADTVQMNEVRENISFKG